MRNNDSPETYIVFYEDDDPRKNAAVMTVSYNWRFAETLIPWLVRLIAFEQTWESKEYQWQFCQIMGWSVRPSEVERWVVGQVIDDLAVGLVSKSIDGVGICGFGEVFADKLTEPFRQENETPEKIERLFQKLDDVARENRAAVQAKLQEKLSSLSRFINTAISFRLRAMIIQLFADSVLSTFPKPSRKMFEQIEKGVLASIKLFLEESQRLGNQGRPPDSGTVNSHNARDVVNEIIKKGIGIFKAEGKVTKVDVAKTMRGRHNISSDNEKSGLKALDRAIQAYNPDWCWMRDILPLIKSRTLLP
ncbi:MAG: hypothetical protein AB1631_10185 [Acidobacteriota bacterium]